VPEVLDPREWELVSRVLAMCATNASLPARVAELTQLAELLGAMPSLEPAPVVDQMCKSDRYAADLHLPAKAGLTRTFLVAKIQLFQALRTALGKASQELSRELRREIAESVFTLLAEELLRSLVYDRSLTLTLRERAGRTLARLWDLPALVEIGDFCPSLELAWDARAKAGTVFGTLMGTAEYFGLVQQDCPENVLTFFARSEIPEEESQAFQEFLLGLPWDDVVRLRERMKKEGRAAIDPNYAMANLTISSSQLSAQGAPEAVFASFRRRMHHAEMRRSLRHPGPTRTAEAYLLTHLLQVDPILAR